MSSMVITDLCFSLKTVFLFKLENIVEKDWVLFVCLFFVCLILPAGFECSGIPLDSTERSSRTENKSVLRLKHICYGQLV